MKKLISILLAVILIAAMFAGCKGKKATVSDYSGMENVQAMIEYAQMLEEQGNKEAAAQVWAMIPDAADESAREELRNEAEGSNEMQAFESMGNANGIINSLKGGK
jgi:hypothetical protein